jgi:hypothetical protein
VAVCDIVTDAFGLSLTGRVSAVHFRFCRADR